MIYLTVRNTSGGNHGHQLKDLIGGYTISQLFKYEYVHSYYPYLEFYGLGFGEKKVEELDENIQFHRVGGPFWGGVNFDNVTRIFGEIEERYKDQDLLISVENALRVFPHQTIVWKEEKKIEEDVFESVYKSVSEKFVQKHNIKEHQNEDFVVAIHISRGESYNREKYPQHFADSWNVRFIFEMDYFEKIIDQIRTIPTDRKVRFDIYTEKLNSEEIVERFSDLDDVSLHVGSNRESNNQELVRNIFMNFITADVLVSCNSSFSTMAAYFRYGKPTLYHPHSHLNNLPERDFYATGKDGSFDIERLKKIIK